MHSKNTAHWLEKLLARDIQLTIGELRDRSIVWQAGRGQYGLEGENFEQLIAESQGKRFQ